MKASSGIFVKNLKLNTMKLKTFLVAILLVTCVNDYSFAGEFDHNDLKKNKELINDKETGETIVSVAASNKDFTTLVAAVKAAGLINILNGQGPYTVFAPVNSAFKKLPKGTVETLLNPKNKKLLTSILTYHVVAGKFKAVDVVKAIKSNDGKFTIKTVQGSNLTASLYKGNVILTDANGNTSKVIITDVKASNGIVHAIDSVVMPK